MGRRLAVWRAAGLSFAALCAVGLAPVAARASSSAYVVNFGAGQHARQRVSVRCRRRRRAFAERDPDGHRRMGPFAIAISPDGKSAYVADVGLNGSFEISQYTVGPGGVLSPMTPATAPGGLGPAGVAVSPDGKSVYVTNNGSSGPGWRLAVHRRSGRRAVADDARDRRLGAPLRSGSRSARTARACTSPMMA